MSSTITKIYDNVYTLNLKFNNSPPTGMFPKVLPRAAARKREELRRQSSFNSAPVEPEKPSFKDMLKTFHRLIRNPTLMYNNLASVFYFFGYIPYWIFTPKYIEIQYHQSASVSSLVTGTVALAFSAIGVLLSGIIISKYKPRARYMAAWNVFVGGLSAAGMISYIFLGCPASDNNLASLTSPTLGISPTFSPNGNASLLGQSCFAECGCDYVKYSPVCGQDGKTYISACHAGCKEQVDKGSGSKLFTQCSCIGIGNRTAMHPDDENSRTADKMVNWNFIN